MNKDISILIVDDNQDLLRTFCLILKREGYSIDRARNYISAMDKCDQRHFDIVLMDVITPRIEEFKALRNIKNKGLETKIIIMAADCDEVKFRQAIKSGAFCILQKPVEYNLLLGVIQKAVGPVAVIDAEDVKNTSKTLSKV